MAFLILLLTLTIDIDTLKLDEWGLYIPNGITVQKMGDHYVVGGNRSDCFVVIDRQGQLLAKYDLSGEGPNRLQNSYLLGVRENQIFLTKKNIQPILFDGKLQPSKKEPPRLPFFCLSGVALEGDAFLVKASTSKFALYRLLLKDDKWEVKEGAFLRQYDSDNYRYDYGYQHQNGLVFQLSGFEHEPDNYEVFVHDVSKKLKPNVIQALGHTLENEPGLKNSDVYYSQAFRAGDHYVVLLQLAYAKPIKVKRSVLDVFKLNGDFVKRMEVPRMSNLIPVENAFEVFLPSDDGETATRLRF